MGNTVSHVEVCQFQEQRGTLDLSLHVNYEQYCQHALGLAPQGSLTNLTPRLPTSPTLYSGLNASFNWLSEIPSCIPQRLPHLVTLDLSHNRLNSVSDVILLALPHLRDLSISHNLLTSLPEILPLLPKLTRLNCSHNAIESLPAGLGNCPNLRALDCSQNRLKQLPAILGSSHNLRLLLAAGNPCISPPKDICEKGSEETLKYLKALAYGMDPSLPTPLPNIKESQRQQKLVFPRVLGGIASSSVGALGGANAGSVGGGVGGKDAWSREHYMEMHGQMGLQTARGLRTPLFPPPGSTSLDAMELRDRIAGLLFGAALGDSIGLATEFLSLDECMFHYSHLNNHSSNASKWLPNLHHDCIIRDGHRVRWDRGDWTSHCEIMLLVLDSILQWGGVVDELDFAQRLKTWADTYQASQEGGCDGSGAAGPQLKEGEAKSHYSHISSPVIRKVISRPNFCKCPHDSAHSVWKEDTRSLSSAGTGTMGEECYCLDNGSLPQSIVLGIPHFHNLTEVSSNSSRICQTLHQDPTCVASSVAVSVIVAQLLQGKLIEEEHKEETITKSLDSIFLAARDTAWPYLKDSDPKVQAAFEACFRPRSEHELQALVTQEVRHSFTALSVAAYILREDRECAASEKVNQNHPVNELSSSIGFTPVTIAAGDSHRVVGSVVEDCDSGTQGKQQELDERFRRGVCQAALLCGHASANCCLSGALLGCVYGFSNLPAQWVEGLNPTKRIMLISRTNSLLNIMALP